MNVEALSNDIDFRSKITREEFNEMNEDIWARALAPVQKLLDDSGVSSLNWRNRYPVLCLRFRSYF